VHQDAVADGDAQRAAAAAFPVDDDDDRRVERGHLAQVERDGLGDATLLGLDARVGGRRVDEREDRPAELLGQLHRPQRLPVALRPGVAEIAVDLLLRVAAPLVMADDQHGLVLVAREARHDRVVVGEAAVPADLGELGEEPLHVVQYRGPLRVTGHEHALPGRERGVDLPADRLDPPVQPVDGLLALGRLRQHRERLDFLQQDGDGLLEFERIRRHGQRRSL